MTPDIWRIGNLSVFAPLGRSRFGDRWLARDEMTHDLAVVYWLAPTQARVSTRQLAARLDQLLRLHHTHILSIETVIPGVCSSTQGFWVVAPFTGHHTGLLTLDRLLAEKGGTMPIVEVERCLLHLLEASEYANNQGVIHGPILGSEIQIDRRGSLLVELYGLSIAFGHQDAHNPDANRSPYDALSAAEFIRDEVRSIVALGYQLITGLSPQEPRLRLGKLIRQLDPTWDEWIDMGLDPSGGFASASEALGQLPSARGVPESVAAPIMVKTMVNGMFKALRGVTGR